MDISPPASNRFVLDEDAALAARFEADGYIIAPVEDRTALEHISQVVATRAAKKLGQNAPEDTVAFLDGIGALTAPETLNDLRLDVIAGMQADAAFRANYFALARRTIDSIVGNELAMQRNVNLSIQLPNDASSLLPVHADVLNGDSEFEVVLWVPLVDCHRTKSMYLLPPARSEAVLADFGKFEGRGSEDLFASIEKDLLWLDVPYGHFLLFSQNLLHGNRINLEPGTRWSMNCRFKSLLSPYADKRFGEFFEPIVIRPATRLGMRFRAPRPFGGDRR